MKTFTSTTRTTLRVMVCFALLLTLAVLANAQTFVTNPTSTTLWAGSQDTATFGFSQFTAPFPSVILSGTAISAITGKPVRHLWYGDPLNGFCRIDPEVDAVIAPVAGIGGHNVNFTTCLASISTRLPVPGQVTFDASTNTLYTEDISRANIGIYRMHYIPSGDSGQGSIDIVHAESLLGTLTGINAFGGCPALKDPKTGVLVPNVPNSAALGPDGNLYTGSIRDGAIIRILSPATFNPATQCPNPNKLNQPGDQVQIPILSADEQFGSGHTFGLGFIGTTLFGADNIAPWMMVNATQCLTPLNNNKICGAPALGGSAPGPIEILATQVAGPQAGLVSDAIYPTLPGAVVYAATFPNVARLTNILSPTSMTVNLNYGGTFSFITGLAADPQDPNNSTVYVGADPTQGGINGSGQIWQVSAPCLAVPPATAVITSAVAGPGNGQATVSWAPPLPPGCVTSATSSYVVQTLLASATGGAPTASTVPNVTIASPTTIATINGLTIGTSYVFEVQACNSIGCSAFSAPSAVVVPFACTTAPLAPTNVVAVAGNASASVSWTNAASCSAILSSTVNAFDSLAPAVVAATVTVPAPATGAVVTGLINGHTYTFTVFDTNSLGNSAQSAASLPITLPVPTTADVSITMTAPATINPGSILTFTMTVNNAGPAAAAQVLLSDTLPAPFVSATTTQGVCAGTAGQTTMTCNLGSLAAGATSTITVSVQTPTTAACSATSLTNTATVSALNSAGGNIDPNLANNTASASTTTLIPFTCTTTTTDIQVTGSAQNGGPAVGSADTITWQIKNNLGTTPANNVVFSSNMTGFSQVVATPSQGTCTVFNNGIQCQLGTINGGSTAIVTVNFNVGTVAAQFLTGGSATFTGTDTNPANNSFPISIQTK